MKKIYISGSIRSDDFYTFQLKRDLTEMNYEVLNKETDDSFDESKVSPEYLISQSDIVIAIIRGNNPFVFYELGYASALGKKVLIVSDSEYDLPISLKKNYNIRFDSGMSNSIYNILNFLKNTNIEEKALSDNIQTFEELIINLKNNPQIIDRISALELEQFIYTYFQKKGVRIQMPNYSSDYGYDFILTDWKGHRKTIVEVKKYNKNSKVSVNTIQQLVGAMNIYEADHAIIITTSEFTASAKEFAKSMTKEIELWDIGFLTKDLR